MEWFNVLTVVLGALGGTAGIISIYHAKSNKDTIDIKNMQEMLDAAHQMFDTINKEREDEMKAFHKYKEDNMKYVAEFKERFRKLEERVSDYEDVIVKLRSSIYSCYRCTLPTKIEECPVLVAFRHFFSENDIEHK